MRVKSTILNRCRCHRTAAVERRTSCRWRPPIAGCPKWQESTLQAELWTIKNIGAGTAVNLSYRWESEGNEIQIGELPFATLEKEEANLTFFHIKIALMPQYAAYQTKASLYIIYQDLLENKYEQEVVLTYDVSTSDKTELTDMIVHAPKLVK